MKKKSHLCLPFAPMIYDYNLIIAYSILYIHNKKNVIQLMEHFSHSNIQNNSQQQQQNQSNIQWFPFHSHGLCLQYTRDKLKIQSICLQANLSCNGFETTNINKGKNIWKIIYVVERRHNK